MSLLDWRGWDRLDRLDRRFRLGRYFHDTTRDRAWVRWWPWSFVLFVVAATAGLTLTVLGHAVGSTLLVLALALGFNALQAWVVTHPRRLP